MNGLPIANLPMLDTLDSIVNRLLPAVGRLSLQNSLSGVGQLYCPGCGDYRSHELDMYPNTKPLNREGLIETLSSGISPMVATCRNCQFKHSGLVVPRTGQSPNWRLVWIPHGLGGHTTPHTPQAVGYYVEQAALAESTGARSASVAMYRSALEHLLHEQGFTEAMLGPKLKSLETQLNNGKGPKWAQEVGAPILKVLKDLGNAAIHANGGDITKQDALDGDLLAQVKIAFRYILQKAYEDTFLQAEVLARLSTAKRKTDP